jgi:hypothetical protein
VYLELLLLHETIARQESANVFALIALQLKYFPVLRMVHDGSIAGKLLFASPNPRGCNVNDPEKVTSSRVILIHGLWT